MITLIKNAEVYAPRHIGRRDVLLTADRICRIGEVIEIGGSVEYTEIDATGKIMFPGFIDSHVHIAGGGGSSASALSVAMARASSASICALSWISACFMRS